MEQVQLQLRLELMVLVAALLEGVLLMVAQELKLEALAELDFVGPGLLVPLLLQLLLWQVVLRAAVADELAPAAVVLLLVRHPSGHTQPSGFLNRLTVETTFNSQRHNSK